ncbi:o-succinylbenzoate--CoA ligase [Gordonia sp. (in: high G+C Gram-positive bacteria)]|uniref:o-succinylbenzoate--CoA ligase n=1 Tax=Gordonia sp. (in: high G+C Gram-positive bacteria) TaxID=84139 RepID=UPI0016A3A2D5|nr:o-succinylbenzoate--CoA ligase [Gordonia sp. (in: high G+C Gram-positive bacteria)]NLG45520.1 o-succinylbenzoate--CoA ligase [Gordonia sp. (in: high G+C Gram-positive bacteria)]
MLDARRDLTALLDGDAAYLPLPADNPADVRRLSEALALGSPIDDDAALVVSTSGTTGTPKGAVHTAASLRASIDATAEVLGGPGSWLLAMPPHHIAGLQVLLRSLAAGYDPVVLDLAAGFDPAALPAQIAAMPGHRRYTSLVPMQLRKALDDPRASAALADLDAILVGGAATGASLAARALDAGLPIVRTYGMSETAGGCVYDGLPLPGTRLRIMEAGDDGAGRVALGGATLAKGYRNLPDHPAFADPGWFLTDDLGALDDHLLRIVGRADEAISTGGLTVVPQVVEAVISEVPGVADCAVFGVPDERLGEQVVVAVVAATEGPRPDDAVLRAFVTERLDRYAAPRKVFLLDALTLRGPGKVDRRALRERFA